VAGGEELPLTQDQIRINGHALEARIYAEDPAHDFLPASGTLTFLQPPQESEHVRVDTGVLQGDEVSVYYDPMIAKLIVWDENRDKALRRLTKALAEYRIAGMATNIDFLHNLVCCEAFKRAEIDTGFIEKHNEEIFHSNRQDTSQGIALAGLYLVLKQAKKAEAGAKYSPDPWSPWNNTRGWRLNEALVNRFELLFQEQQYPVTIEQLGQANLDRYLIHIGNRTVQAQGKLEGNVLHADIDGHRLRALVGEHDGSYSLFTRENALQFRVTQADLGDEDAGQGAGALNAPMNGTIVELTATEGVSVKRGDTLLVMEAMKMEHTIRAPADGKVAQFYYQLGDLVDGGAELLDFDVDSEKTQ
jgi:3-methylcrotonyl-CoA carboxylase alpha subunit